MGADGDDPGDSPAKAAAARATMAIRGRRRGAHGEETPAVTTTGQPSITPTNGTAEAMDGGAVGGIPKRKASPARGKSRSLSPMDMGSDRTHAEEKERI